MTGPPFRTRTSSDPGVACALHTKRAVLGAVLLSAMVVSLGTLGCDSRSRAGAIPGPSPSTDGATGDAPTADAATDATSSGTAAPRVPCANPRKSPRIATKDGKLELFVSPIPNTKFLSGRGEDDLEDLCILRDGKPPEVIVPARERGPDGTFIGAMSSFWDLLLSPDESLLFFTTSLTTHTALAYALDLATGKVTFLFDGTVEAAIVRGRYAGHYLASHTRLDREHPVSSKAYRGRMTTWDVVTKAGKTVRELRGDEVRTMVKSDTATPVPLDEPGRYP